MTWVAKDKIDYAEEMGPIIVYLTKKDKPVLLAILDTSEFLSKTAKHQIKGSDTS
jgi:hypothetical protein